MKLFKNNSQIILFITLTLFSFAAWNCRHDEIDAPEWKEQKVYIEKIIPDRQLKIGEKFIVIIKAENMPVKMSPFLDLTMNGKEYFGNEYKTDTILTYVPYTPVCSNKWIFKALAGFQVGPILSERHFLTDTLDVVSENCTGGVQVKWSDIDSVAESESFTLYGNIGEIYRWKGSIAGDTVTLVSLTPYGDDGLKQLTFKFIDMGPNQLPRFISAEGMIGGISGCARETIRNAIFKIQSWDSHGIISGIFLPEVIGIWAHFDIKKVFWVNMKKN